MPSFDIASKVDQQTLDNAVNTSKKEILNRFDFRGSKTEIELDKKNLQLEVMTEDDMKLRAIEDILISRAVKQGIDGRSFDFTKEIEKSGMLIKKVIPLKSGLDKEVSKKIVKLIKDSGIKVQAAIMDDQIRVTGKKIDDLQATIARLRTQDFGQPLQFVNMKS
jgi:cyclic-di-GMP-binding protein